MRDQCFYSGTSYWENNVFTLVKQCWGNKTFTLDIQYWGDTTFNLVIKHWGNNTFTRVYDIGRTILTEVQLFSEKCTGGYFKVNDDDLSSKLGQYVHSK